jgi:hypothetical protein
MSVPGVYVLAAVWNFLSPQVTTTLGLTEGAGNQDGGETADLAVGLGFCGEKGGFGNEVVEFRVDDQLGVGGLAVVG